MNKPLRFEIEKKIEGSLARVGTIHTPHGVIETPAFIAVGTKAAVRGLSPDMLVDAGVEALIANTYHLYMQPGDAKVRACGGLHRMM